MTSQPLRITAMHPDEAAKAMAAVYRRSITPQQVREVVEAGNLASDDGTFSLIDYVAYLATEVAGG